MLKNLQPYIKLVSDNHNYRRLWLSQIISNFGDWFGILAIYALIAEHSGSEFLLGLLIVVKMLSLAFFSPFAGIIADRFNRRRLMVLCDVGRGVIVLGFLLIHSYDTLWLAYVLTAMQMMLSAIFEPAKTSSIPNVTTDRELVNANVLSAASWSIIFTSGMALGGFATELLGTDVVFISNSVSYLLSAWFIYRALIPQKMMTESQLKASQNPFTGIKRGFAYLIDNRQILRPTLAKGTFTMFLGALVYMLIIVSEEILMMGSIGLGLLYAARGVGTGIGPVIGRRIFRHESMWISAMGLCMIFAGIMYVIVGLSSGIALMLLFVFIAHTASGANWVMSTVLLQRRTPDTFRGRIFSTEWLLFTMAQSISVTVASLLLEYDILSINHAIILFAVLLSVAGLIWSFTIRVEENRYQANDSDRALVKSTVQ